MYVLASSPAKPAGEQGRDLRNGGTLDWVSVTADEPLLSQFGTDGIPLGGTDLPVGEEADEENEMGLLVPVESWALARHLGLAGGAVLAAGYSVVRHGGG